MQEEEEQRDADAAEHGEQIVRARHIHPRRHIDRAHSSPTDLAQEIPSLRKVAGEKQREQQANEFHWLQRSQVDFGVAARGTRAKDDQRDRDPQGAGQWQITEAGARQSSDVDCGDERETEQACGGQLSVPDEQRRIA